MDNYICINGKKAELTEKQMRALGIESYDYKDPFRRVLGERYYFTHGDGSVYSTVEKDSDLSDGVFFSVGNYCTDKELMEQQVLRETLARLLWRFSEQNGGRGMFCIADRGNSNFCAMTGNYRYLEPTFKTVDVANRAITKIVKPFMKAHPDFVW